MNLFLPHNVPQVSSKSFGAKSQAGFTLLEMVITIAIVSLLLGLAVTGMQSVIERSQSNDTMAKLRMDTVFSRGEAIKRGGWVGICGTDDGSSCTNSFQDGWMVFHDLDRNRTFNNNDTILSLTRQEHVSLTIDIEELTPAAGGALMFNYRGYPDRSVRLRTSKGQATSELVIQTTGNIEQDES